MPFYISPVSSLFLYPSSNSPGASLDLLKIIKIIFLLNVSQFFLMSGAFLYQCPLPTYVLYPERLLCWDWNAGLFSVIIPEQSWKAVPSLRTFQLHGYLYKINTSVIYDFPLSMMQIILYFNSCFSLWWQRDDPKHWEKLVMASEKSRVQSYLPTTGRSFFIQILK